MRSRSATAAGELLEQDRADTAAEDGALRVGVEGTAMSVGREMPPFTLA